MARAVLPTGVRRAMRRVAEEAGERRAKRRMARLKRKVWTRKPGSKVRCGDYDVVINHGPNFYVLYRDIFVKRIYHFEARRSDPLILDCGSNIGMSILYLKHAYPGARIIGFEPDPTVFSYLRRNVADNHLTDVRLVQAAIAGEEGMLTFYSDGKFGSRLEHPPPGALSGPGGAGRKRPGETAGDMTKIEVPGVRLRDHLAEPVDFVKMNIEGAEYEALLDAADRLRAIREMVVEYHHLPGLPRTLHGILSLLHEHGFEYLVNDFDSETNAGVTPPFRLAPDARYCLLIYARRMD